MHPILIQIGSFEIRWYGAMIALACLVGYWLAGREAERKGIGKEKFQEFFLYAVIGAVVGTWRCSGKIRFPYSPYGKAGWPFTVPYWADFW
jgi:hypothetical protein